MVSLENLPGQQDVPTGAGLDPNYEHGLAETLPNVSSPPPTAAATSAPTQQQPAPQPQSQPGSQSPTQTQPQFWTVQQAQAAGGMDPTFSGKLEQLIALGQKSGHRIGIGSGFRSVAKQQDLYAQAVQKYGAANAGNWVAPPGESNHNRGEAADLTFGSPQDIQWVHQVAPQLGLNFPMSWEPWHIEPAGLRAQSNPQAYTQGPQGSINPTQDQPSMSENLGMLANHVTGSWLTQTPTSDITGTSQGGGLGGMLTGGSVGNMLGTAGGPSANTYNTPFINTANTRSGTAPLVPTGGTGGTGSTSGGAGVNTAVGNVSAQAASPSQQAFIQEIMPYAKAEEKRTGIPAEVMIVQSGVETGWGTSGWWTQNRNPAGIGVTGAPGAGNSYPTLAAAFHDYANKLMGIGEAGQEQFARDVQAGAPVSQLLADLEQAPWAAGHYGGNGLGQTYQALQQGGAFTQAAPVQTQSAPQPSAPAPSAPAPAPQPPYEQPAGVHRNM